MLEKLKAATYSYHIAIEKTVRLLALETSIIHYQNYLKQLYGFYLPIEKKLSAIRALQQAPFHYNDRQKTPLLKSDLQTFHINEQSVLLCQDLPLLTGMPQALGCCYVLEGATWGGQILFQQLKKCLPIKGKEGCAYLISYGDRTNSMWTIFKGALQCYATEHPAAEEILVASAIETFIKMRLWLEEIPTYDEIYTAT